MEFERNTMKAIVKTRKEPGIEVLDVAPVITHRLPLDRAEEGFKLALAKEAGKVLFCPNPDII